MKNEANPTTEPNHGLATAPLWQRLKSKRISYFTLPLLVMATLTEIVILATGWKYQQAVCVPSGMGVTFFGIGPIGATILAVELLKLPLAIWTASRTGWQKTFMVACGLPLICILTFQLVKDMAVYEMGVAMTPASQMLEKAAAEETKISQLNGELSAIGGKKEDRDRKLAELAAKKAKAKTEIEEALKRNDESRHDAISLTDYQKQELSEVEARQAAIIKQFDGDTAQINAALAEFHARREKEVARATEWNAEEARIENVYKQKLATYANAKAAYEKSKAEYDAAGLLRRQVLTEPVSPGVPPEREVNKLMKPTAIAELDAQIQTKEAELATVSAKRRERVAQVSDDARRLREEFDHRSATKREASDRKREELQASLAALTQQWAEEEKAIGQQYETTAQKVDTIRAEIDAATKRANEFYEAREAAIKNTQVHRIATTVEIVRGLIFGQRPVSITATAKERGDLYTDQISMVRIWVYPALAFIVAFLPTLMVEIGFSTLFHPEPQRPPHRLGFLGRRLHSLYTRAGRLKILRAERLAAQATQEIATRDRKLTQLEAELSRQATALSAAAAEQINAKDAEAESLRSAMASAAAAHAKEAQQKEQEWVTKFAGMADSLNRSLMEKEALRDLQKAEVERQVALRQNAWSDRLAQLAKELDEHRATAERERLALIQEHHGKLLEVAEEGKMQLAQMRRQLTDAELASMDAAARVATELKEALQARDDAEKQLQHQAEIFDRRAAQLREEATREAEKALRVEKQRCERLVADSEKGLRAVEAEFRHQLAQREQELLLAGEARLADQQAKLEQDARRRESELNREFESRLREVDSRSKQELAGREEAAQVRLTQREQQLLAQAEVRLADARAEAALELSRREAELEHRFKQREQDLALGYDGRLGEEKTRIEQQARRREAELVREAEARLRDVESRFKQELASREEASQIRLGQREQQLAAEAESRVAALKTEAEQLLHSREGELEHRLKQREQEFALGLDARVAEERSKFEQESRRREGDFARELELRVREAEGRAKQEIAGREEAAKIRGQQREQQLAAQAEARLAAFRAEAEQVLRNRESEFEHRLQQREQELALAFEARMVEARSKSEQEARRRENELGREAEARLLELGARSQQELQRREEAAQIRFAQREQQLQTQAESRLHDALAKAEQEQRRREAELQRQLEVNTQEAEARLRQELQQKESALHSRLLAREQELTARAAARETELQTQWAADLRTREQQWEQQSEGRVRAVEARLVQEAQQKEESFQARLRQREQQLQAQFDARQAESKTKWEAEAQARALEWQRQAEAANRSTEVRWQAEALQREESFQSKLRQHDQQWQGKLEAAQAETRAQVEQEFRRRDAAAAESAQRNLRELEEQHRKELAEKRELLQTAAKEREQELLGQLAAQAAEHAAARSAWTAELEQVRHSVEPLQVQLARAEQEREAAVRSASEGVARVKEMEEKMLEVSSMLSGWKHGPVKNGNGSTTMPSNGNGHGKKWVEAWVGREEF